MTHLFPRIQLNTVIVKYAQLYAEDYRTVAPSSVATLSAVFDTLQMDSLPAVYPTSDPSVFTFLNKTSLRYLTIISSKFPYLTEGMDLNHWTALDGTFSLADYPALEAFYLTNGQVPHLVANFFTNTTSSHLRSFTLTKSELTYISLAIVSLSPALERLILSENQLHQMHWLTVKGTVWSKLTHLDLSANRLSFLPDTLLDYTPALRAFRLSGNTFQTLSVTMMSPFYSLDEFTLPSPSSKLYFTEEFQNFSVNLQAFTGNLPAYFLNGLLNEETQYICENCKSVTYFDLLNKADCLPFKTIPSKEGERETSLRKPNSAIN